LCIYSINDEGKLSENKLGLNIGRGESPQIIIKAGDWFGAKLQEPESYCLAGCTVSPGFHFDDFEMGSRKRLTELFPQHKDIIEQLTG
jgi:predicted cupin superfamily sugar epimerase